MTPDDKTLYARNDDDVDDFAETGYSDAAAEEEYDEEEEEAISQGGAEGERPGAGGPGRGGEAGAGAGRAETPPKKPAASVGRKAARRPAKKSACNC